MKKGVQRLSREALLAKFPIEGRLPGWFFRCKEVSPAHYLAEGSDEWGRLVSRSGADPEQLLKECIEDARSISH